MDLKQKFKVLLNLPAEDEPAAKYVYYGDLIGLTEEEIKQLSRDLKSLQPNQPNPEAQQEALDSIEAGFVDESCDGGSYFLRKLPEQFDLNVIRGHRHLLGIQLSAITNRLYSLILQNQSECAKELQNVLVLQDELDMVRKQVQIILQYAQIFFCSGMWLLQQWTPSSQVTHHYCLKLATYSLFISKTSQKYAHNVEPRSAGPL